MRREYEMTRKQLDKLLDASKPVPYMVFGGKSPATCQENANTAWASLGSEMGFMPMTVEPVTGKGDRFFTAVPTKAVESEVSDE